MDYKSLLTLVHVFLMNYVLAVKAGGPSPPAWNVDTETTSISEGATSGSTVTVTTTAFNTPTSVTILASSTGANAQTLFSVTTDGTNVQLTTAGTLDRETTAQFVLHLRASNSGGDTSTDLNNGDLELTVNIDDVNDNDPVFSTVSKCKAMSADAAGSTSVETMAATDADATANALGNSAYTFSASQSKFDISGSTGEVTVKTGETLTAGAYNLLIVATDSGSSPRSATGTLTVCSGSTCCSSCTDGCSSSGVEQRMAFSAVTFVAFALCFIMY